MIIAIKIGATLGFVLFSALIDSEHLKDKDYIESHVSRGFLRFIFLIVIGLDNWVHGVAASLLFAATFDQTLNALMGNKMWHLGKTAHWDRFFNNKKWLYIILKFAALAVGLYLFLK
jgi:hypothetical protein